MQQPETNVPVAQAALQYAAPVIVLLYYVGAVAVSLCTLQKGQKQGSSRSHRTIRAATGFVFVTYIVQSALLVADSFALLPKISSVAANVGQGPPSKTLADVRRRSMPYRPLSSGLC